MKSVLIFCGSNKGHRPEYEDAAKLTGRILAEQGYEVVYGAGSVGLMGVLADAALEAGGIVKGVITEKLVEWEVCHQNLHELHIVPTMHERKVLMAKMSDAVLTLPGGFGTLDELFEMATLAQLGDDQRPIGLLNTLGFFDHLIQYIRHTTEEGFVKPVHRDMMLIHNDPGELITQLGRLDTNPQVPKWI